MMYWNPDNPLAGPECDDCVLDGHGRYCCTMNCGPYLSSGLAPVQLELSPVAMVPVRTVLNVPKKRFGEILAYYRKKAYLSQVDLANRIGAGHSRISEWETGTSYPAGNVMVKLMVLLEIPAGDLAYIVHPEKKRNEPAAD
jgi:DNA-binding XRE family transcriptional regulator